MVETKSGFLLLAEELEELEKVTEKDNGATISE
jgi:hypothetical protein